MMPQTQVDQLPLWRSYLEIERGLLPSSINQYGRHLAALSEDARKLGLSLETLGSEDLRSWVHKMGGSAASVSSRISAIRSFYRFLVRTGSRVDDPTVSIDAPKTRSGLPKPVKDLDCVLGRLDVLDAHAYRRGGESRAIAVFLAETGLRISEACSLDVPVPCPETLMVLGKGAKEALLPLTAVAREALDFLGGSMPCGVRQIQRRFQAAGTHPHALRHHLGCSLAASGADLGEIQDLLRHANPNTTRTYTAYSLERLRAAQARRR